jgi:hypothetical protein
VATPNGCTMVGAVDGGPLRRRRGARVPRGSCACHVAAVRVEDAAPPAVLIARAGGAVDQVAPNDGRAHQLLKPMPRPAGEQRLFLATAAQLAGVEADEANTPGVVSNRAGVQDHDPCC